MQKHIRARGSRRLGFETLEVREVCAVGAGLSNGTLTITGDGAANNVHVNGNATQYVVTAENGMQRAFAKAGVQRIVANLNGGNDTYTSNVAVPETVHGNDGNDALYGGSVQSILYGDAGSDVVHGRGGADTLYGGTGIDYLNGGAGPDRYEAVDNGQPDRLNGLTGEDSVHGDVLNSVNGRVDFDDHTNRITIVGKTIVLRRHRFEGVEGTFFRAIVNGQDKGVYRASNLVTLFIPRFGTGNSITIDADLRQELTQHGWLNDKGRLA